MDQTRYYIASDTLLLLDMFTTEIAFLKSNWKMLGRPIIVIDFKQSILGKSRFSYRLIKTDKLFARACFF